MFKKYKRFCSIFLKCSAVGGSLSVVLSGSGIATSLTGVDLSVSALLAAVGGVFGIASVVTGVFAKRYSPKLSKHEKTVSVCKAK